MGPGRLRKLAASAGIAVVAAAGSYAGYVMATANYHAVRAGELYRSAQPTAGDIARYSGSDHIATILNLRGEHAGEAWYDEEVAESRRLGIAHVDFRMSSSQELSPDRVAELVGIMRSARKPLLVHCRSGSDRTGLASAIYLARVDGEPAVVAGGALSILYGHVSLPFSAAWPMDTTFAKAMAASDTVFVAGNAPKPDL